MTFTPYRMSFHEMLTGKIFCIVSVFLYFCFFIWRCYVEDYSLFLFILGTVFIACPLWFILYYIASLLRAIILFIPNYFLGKKEEASMADLCITSQNKQMVINGDRDSVSSSMVYDVWCSVSVSGVGTFNFKAPSRYASSLYNRGKITVRCYKYYDYKNRLIRVKVTDY